MSLLKSGYRCVSIQRVANDRTEFACVSIGIFTENANNTNSSQTMQNQSRRINTLAQHCELQNRSQRYSLTKIDIKFTQNIAYGWSRRELIQRDNKASFSFADDIHLDGAL